MLKVALKGLFAHKWRMLITFLSVAFGVAFMGGVLVLTALALLQERRRAPEP